MSDIRFNRWLHQSGTGGIYQDSSGNIGIGTSVPTSALDIQGGQIQVGTAVTIHSGGVQIGLTDLHSTGFTVQNINVTGVVTATSGFSGDLTGNVTGNVTGSITGDISGNATGLSGSPNLVVGILTATSFSGDGSTLTGIDATALKDTDGNVIVQAEASGINVTGVITATTFSGSGSGLTGITESSISNNAITTAKIANNAITTAKIADESITSAKIVSNSTSFDLNRKKLYLPRGFYVYGSDDPVPSGSSLNGFPYGEGHTGWSGYTTISGYAANGSTVTARTINNNPNGLLIIEMSRADAAGGPYGNFVGGHEIWSVNTAHHGFSGGGATLIQSTGTLHGSYTTSGWYGIYITGSTGGTYYRVTFID